MKKITFFIAALFLGICCGCGKSQEISKEKKIETMKPEEVLQTYMKCIEEQEYEALYQMVDTESLGELTKEEFIKRNEKIYQGIQVENIELSNLVVSDPIEDQTSIYYDMTFDTIAGKVSFKNHGDFLKTEKGYKICWNDSFIFPDLTENDKIKVSNLSAERGEILDRNGKVLAGKGVATSVGIIPGKLEEKETSLEKLSQLTGQSVENIEKKLNAKWVKEDYFVPIMTIPKVRILDLMQEGVKEEERKEKERQEQLLEIPGIMLSDVEVRTYPMGEAVAHLVGYVQKVTAEDLKEHSGEGYTTESVIGKTGMEALFEKELRGKDGHRICIVNGKGEEKEEIATILAQDGKNIQLTIDSTLQTSLYEQFQEDKGCSVAMNPYTGEVLALVSTPSYDNNQFLMGMTQEQWEKMNTDERQPMYNRFRKTWCPGSSFKPVVAGIGLDEKAFLPEEDFGKEGTSWQKDASWGTYQVTTLHESEPATLNNALIYSDNIYFAKAALKIGADALIRDLEKLGFGKELPFEIKMTPSQYSNQGKISSEIQLADSGYGQGEILVNPLHLAGIYTAFLNQGNMIKPYLTYKEEPKGQIWIPNAFSEETVEKVMEGLKGVVNDPHGTGFQASREDRMLAGKTGTGEIKVAKEDTTGTELGWFVVFTTEKEESHPILLLSMAEDVKGRGGSGYVVEKEKHILDEWFMQN